MNEIWEEQPIGSDQLGGADKDACRIQVFPRLQLDGEGQLIELQRPQSSHTGRLTPALISLQEGPRVGRSYRLASLAQDKALADVPSGWSRGLPPSGAPGLEAACPVPVLELQRLPLQGRGWAG